MNIEFRDVSELGYINYIVLSDGREIARVFAGKQKNNGEYVLFQQDSGENAVEFGREDNRIKMYLKLNKRAEEIESFEKLIL